MGNTCLQGAYSREKARTHQGTRTHKHNTKSGKGQQRTVRMAKTLPPTSKSSIERTNDLKTV